MDLDARLEQAQHDPAGVDLLLGELVARCLRFVPAAEHVQRVGPFGQHSPFLRTVPELSCEGEGLVEVSERIGVLVTSKALVGEVEVAVARLVSEVVVERYLQGSLEERPGLLGVSPTLGDARFRAQRGRERLRVCMRFGDVQRQLGPLGGTIDVAAEPVPDAQDPRPGARDPRRARRPR